MRTTNQFVYLIYVLYLTLNSQQRKENVNNNKRQIYEKNPQVMQPLQNMVLYQNLHPNSTSYSHICISSPVRFGDEKATKSATNISYVQGKERHADDLYQMQSEQE